MSKGIGGHETSIGLTNEWYTPPQIIRSLGEFDLDPCAPIVRAFDTAKHHYTITDDGLKQMWFGRVWLNPPYQRGIIDKFMRKMAEHDNGISLIFARTDTQFFHKYIFPYCDSMMFMQGRVRFSNQYGMPAKSTAGAPSVLIAYGEKNTEAIGDSGIKGKLVLVNSMPMIVVGISPTWKSVVTIAMSRLKGEGHLKAIYDVVQTIAPDKVEKNSYFKEKLRQTLQTYFLNVGKGIYRVNQN